MARLPTKPLRDSQGECTSLAHCTMAFTQKSSCGQGDTIDDSNRWLGPRVTSAAACILPVVGTLHGRRRKSKLLLGTLILLLSSARVKIIDSSKARVISRLPVENVYELGFSPLGTYFITWQRPSKDEAGDAVKNLKVWRVIEDGLGHDDSEKQTVGRFVQKNQTGWNLQYTFDENFCARVVTNEVQIYESHDLTKIWNKLRVEGVADFAVSPGENHSIAVFVPERKVWTRRPPTRQEAHLARDYRHQCVSTVCTSSTLRPRRRTFSKATKFSLNGTTMEVASLCWRRPRSTKQARITTARPQCTFSAPMVGSTQG